MRLNKYSKELLISYKKTCTKFTVSLVQTLHLRPDPPPQYLAKKKEVAATGGGGGGGGGVCEISMSMAAMTAVREGSREEIEV